MLDTLLQAQLQCRHDIEGVYTLYCQAEARLQSSGGHGTAGLPAGTGAERGPHPIPPADAAGHAHAAANAPSPTVPAGESGRAAAAQGQLGEVMEGAHAAAIQSLLGLGEEEAHAVLRSYVISGTARDCGVMVTLQRMGGETPSAAGGAGPGWPHSSNSTGMPQQEAQQEQAQESMASKQCAEGRPSMGAGVVWDAGTEAWYRYRVALVDLDLKSLGKIPGHMALDRDILAAAQRRLSRPG